MSSSLGTTTDLSAIVPTSFQIQDFRSGIELAMCASLAAENERYDDGYEGQCINQSLDFLWLYTSSVSKSGESEEMGDRPRSTR